MKHLIYVFVTCLMCMFVTVAPAQMIYDNGPLITHPGGGFSGADASALQSGLLNTYGSNMTAAQFKIADDFTVTASGGWFIDSIQFFGYQTSTTHPYPPVSTFTQLRYGVMDGDPSAGGNVIFGDTTVNSMISTRWSGIYRSITTGLTTSNRPIMVMTVPVGTLFPPGSYWLVWRAAGTIASGPWQPPITILGTQTTGNARQWTGTLWQAMRDSIPGAATGYDQGAPFKIYGTEIFTAAKDIYVQSVSLSPPSPQVGSPVTVSAVIENLGTEPDPGSVSLTYKLGSAPADSLDGTVQVFTPSWIGHIATVTFATTATPLVYGNFTTYVRSFYFGDEVAANNTASQTAYAVPAVDFAAVNMWQFSGLPTPLAPAVVGSNSDNGAADLAYAVDAQGGVITEAPSVGTAASDENHTQLLSSPPVLDHSLANIDVKMAVQNVGYSASTYTVNWTVNGVSQTPHSGPSVAGNGGRDTSTIVYTPTARGTFLTEGTVAAGGDPNAANNGPRSFRMRVYPDAYTRTFYDRGNNTFEYWVGGTGASTYICAVRFAAPMDMQVAGVDLLYRTLGVTGNIVVSVRAAGANDSTVGAILYSQTFSGTANSAYYPTDGDYVTFPFDDNAPYFLSGTEYWITVSTTGTPTFYPYAVQTSGFTPGHSLSSTDGTTFSRTRINPGTGLIEVCWIMRAYGVAATPMAYSSSTCTQNTISVLPGTTNAQVIGMQVVTSGFLSPISVTQFNLSTNGSSNAAGDVTNAKVYYTGNSGAFGTGTLFGSFASPNGAFVVSGSQTLLSGTNYFWLAYDISGGATVGNVVDGECSSVTVGGTPQTPTVTAPSGSRQIKTTLSGSYTVGLAPFNRASGRLLYPLTETRKVWRDVWVSSSESAAKSGADGETEHLAFAPGRYQLMEVEEEYSVLMEDGRPVTGRLFAPLTDQLRRELGLTDDPLAVYPTITDALSDLNNLGVSGPVTFLLVDPSYTTGETYPLTVNVTAPGVPTATNTVTIKPNTGVTPSISGSYAGPLFRILNTNYVTIDGSNTAGGTTRDLTITNTNTTSPGVIHIGSFGTTPITNATVKNCILVNGSQNNSAVVVGDGTTYGGAGYFSDITIQNNSISKAYRGIYAYGGLTTANGFNLNVIGNTMTDAGANSIRFNGVITQGIDGVVVRGNEFGNFLATNDEADRAIHLATGTSNAVVEKNKIHDLGYVGINGYGAYGVAVQTALATPNVVVKNNMIYNLTGDGDSYASYGGTYCPIGIYVSGVRQSGVGIYDNSIYLYGNTLNYAGAYSIGICLDDTCSATVLGNVVQNSLGRLGTLGVGAVAIAAEINSTQFTASNYNDFFSNSTGSGTNSVGKIGATDYTTLGTWQAASGQDLNSASADPLFVGNTDLHITNPSSPASNAGTSLAEVTDDFDGDPRNPTTPDMGADEFGSGSSTVTLGVPVALNWNIVSLPVSAPTPNDSVRNLYVNSVNPYAFAFAGGYQQRYTMSNGPGYWIKSTAAYTQDITGTQRDTLTVPVALNWNMIGSISASIDTSAAHVTPSVAGLRGSNYFRYSSGYVVATAITPGGGYWVKANSAGSFFMHATGPAKRSGEEAAGRSIDDLNSITIQDANGGSQTLYFGADASGEIPVAMFAMPPAPPEGSFDARFASSDGGLMVQTHPAEVNTVIDLPVTIQSSAYPLTVSWKIGDGLYELNDGAMSRPVRGEGALRVTNSEVRRLVLKVTGSSGLPKEFALSQNYPNPFNPTTNIKYALPVDSRMTMEIYNVLGQRVRTLVNDNVPAGYHVAEWNGKNNAGQQLASGIYFLQLSARGTNGKSFNEVRKLMMLK